MQSEPSLQIIQIMDSNDIKSRASSFLRQFGLREVTLESLCTIVRKQGYTIIEFNHISNSENVTVLLSALGLLELSRRAKGFTYADSRHRLVFIHEALSDDEKLMVLAHEEGHIYCNHFNSTPVLGRDVIEEHEANEFAHYLLHRSVWRKVGCVVKKHKKASIAIVLTVVLIVVSCIIGYRIHCENTYYGKYYVTSTGNKYHDKECGYVKGKDNAERLKIEQYESGEYAPCEKCIGN